MVRFAIISIGVVLSGFISLPVYGADGEVSVSVTDDREYIRPGGAVVYRIVIKDTSDSAKTITPVFTLSEPANISPDKGGKVDGQQVSWPETSLERGKEVVFTVTVNLPSGLAEGTVLRARVEELGNTAEDSTVISATPLTSHHFSLTITDAKTTISPGQSARFTALVKNTGDVTRTTPITLILPVQYDISTTNPSGSSLQGNTVEWPSMTFNAAEEKTFTVDARLSGRVPEYVLLTTQLLAGGTNAVDTTSVQTARGTSSRSSSSSLSRASSFPAISTSTSSAKPTSVLLSQTAESNEVLAGGRVRYTIYIQNVLLSVLRNATVTVQFNPTQLTPIDSNGALHSEGALTWTIPTLAPGAIWTMKYDMVAAPSLTAGSAVQTVATLTGPETDTAILTERVSITQSNIVVNLPQTGADLAYIGLGIIGLLSFVSVFIQKSSIQQ